MKAKLDIALKECNIALRNLLKQRQSKSIVAEDQNAAVEDGAACDRRPGLDRPFSMARYRFLRLVIVYGLPPFLRRPLRFDRLPPDEREQVGINLILKDYRH